ncbi:MAG: hypothetical protein AAGD28_07150 [Bacteroidota bacterium]
MRILSFLLIASLLFSCRYDQDFEFVPKTQQAYFLMDHNGQRELRLYEPEGNIFLNEWGVSKGLNNPGDIAGAGEELWISLPDQSSLARFDIENDELENFSLGNFKAHFLCVGERYLLMSDTLTNQLGFFHLKRKELTSLDLDQQPGKAAYRSTKFYLILGEKDLAIYNELALAPEESLSFEREIFDLVIDNRFSTWVYTRDSLNYRSTVSWNSNSVDIAAIEVLEDKVAHSPYLQPTFDKEFTGIVALSGNRLLNFPNPLADDFAADFFEGNAYYVANDSLRLLNLAGESTQLLGSYSGTFANSFFYLAPDAN